MSTKRLAMFLLVWCAAVSAQAAQRVALVLGNSRYQQGLELRNPANDAREVSACLKSLGFQVIEGYDLDLAGMEEALRVFRRTLREGDFAWFFYAGHGIQSDNCNYLLPVGADVKEAYELRRKTMDLDTVKGAMKESGAKLNVLILDCCRNNPLTRSWTRSMGSRGLARQQDLPEGTIVAYSTAENTEAADGEGEHSPYSEKLIATLRARPAGGLELKRIFFTVAQDVKQITGQSPALYLDAALPDFYLDRRDDGGALAGVIPPSQLIASAAKSVADSPPAGQLIVPSPADAAAAAPSLPPAGLAQPVAQAAGAAAPGVVNTLGSVFANGPYASYNDYSKKQVLRQAQTKLQQAGYYAGAVDGGMGPNTQNAINLWQIHRNLARTGLLDQATLQDMALLGLAEQTPPQRKAPAPRRRSSSSDDEDDEEDSDGGGSSKWRRAMQYAPFFRPF